jgi:hypothetical protein
MKAFQKVFTICHFVYIAIRNEIYVTQQFNFVVVLSDANPTVLLFLTLCDSIHSMFVLMRNYDILVTTTPIMVVFCGAKMKTNLFEASKHARIVEKSFNIDSK